MRVFTTGEVAARLGVRREWLYYWEERSKIPRARRTGSGKRFYTSADLQRLRRMARALIGRGR